MFTNLRIEDSGMYQCIADNGVDNIYQTARLNVQGTDNTFKLPYEHYSLIIIITRIQVKIKQDKKKTFQKLRLHSNHKRPIKKDYNVTYASFKEF